ncbi:Beta-amyrin synthase [Vitis vinifera]|uniref:Beta-amyrin synthase n=1 Tax=Vitis vinifera TaxID=29760 RepID=A0A438CIV3_VITVI|nr:Beta-amyrin synthase [Vitis vinifera]
MWRLKLQMEAMIPTSYSTNNFVGRQIWEFDPDYGTPEERAEVEAARENFWKNRFQVKPAATSFGGCRLVMAIGPAENAGPLYFLPPLVMCLYITGHLDTVFPGEYRKEILRYLYCHQNEDGGWGLHIEGHSTMFVQHSATFVCVSFEKGAMVVETMLVQEGIFGLFDWSGSTQCPQSFGSSLLVFLCIQEDLYYPHPLIQDLMWDSLYRCTEPLLTCWPFNKLRQKALEVTMKHIHYEDENSRYITIASVQKALCMLACWVEDPNGDNFKKHLARIPDFIWVAEDGIKMQTFGSQEWDTGFALQALLACNMTDEIGPTLKKGHEFIKESQVKDNPSGDLKACIATFPKDRGHSQIRIMVGKFLIALQKCCLLFSMMAPEIVGMKMEPERLFDSVNILLSLQVRIIFLEKNGGLAVWEPAGASEWTKEIDNFITNATKYIEDQQMPDGSCADPFKQRSISPSMEIGSMFHLWLMVCTWGLAAAGRTYHNCLAIGRAVEFLLKSQSDDGGWEESYIFARTRKQVKSSTNRVGFDGAAFFWAGGERPNTSSQGCKVVD